jgi:hypothetical protein
VASTPSAIQGRAAGVVFVARRCQLVNPLSLNIPIGRNIMKFNRKLLLVAAALAAVVGEAGAAGIYEAKTTAAVYLPSPGWNYVTSVSLPAGTWVLQALSPAVNFGATDITRCMIWHNGVMHNISSAMTGGAGGMPAAVGVQNLVVLTTTYNSTAYLYCGHDAAVADQRIDPGAVLVATRAPAN